MNLSILNYQLKTKIYKITCTSNASYFFYKKKKFKPLKNVILLSINKSSCKLFMTSKDVKNIYQLILNFFHPCKNIL